MMSFDEMYAEGITSLAAVPTTAGNAARRVLDRLQGVKVSKPGSWMALCPAHEDRSPSLSIRELIDGRVLLHCFSGCETADVLKAIDLTISDLFLKPLENYLPPVTGGFTALELLRLIQHEVTVAALIVSDAAARPLTDEEQNRLWDAAGRIGQARGYAYGGK
jgi:hypothetical protein